MHGSRPSPLGELFHSFSPQTLERSEEYCDPARLQIVDSQEFPLRAMVRGNRWYDVSLHFDDRRGFHSDCTCPVGIDCKHGAAVAQVLWERGACDDDDDEDDENDLAPDVTAWLGRLGRLVDRPPHEPSHTVVYMLADDGEETRLIPQQAAIGKRGRLLKPRRLRLFDEPYEPVPPWMTTDDLRRVLTLRALGRWGHLPPTAESLPGAVLQDLAATERLYWKETRDVLDYGPARQVRLGLGAPGPGDAFSVVVEPALRVLCLGEPHYLDEDRGEIGPLEADVPAPLLRQLLRAPPVPADMLPTVRRGLASLLGRALPIVGAAPARVATPEPQPEPVPHLRLGVTDAPRAPLGELTRTLEVRYGDHRFPLGAWSGCSEVVRDLVTEQRLADRFENLAAAGPEPRYRGPSRELAEHLAGRVVPTLRLEGWEVEIDAAFPATAPATAFAVVENAMEAGPGGAWFEYELGVEIQGKTFSLLPLLLGALNDRRLDLRELARNPRHQGLWITLRNGTHLHLSADRLRRWLRPLVELQLRGLERGALRVPALALATFPFEEPSGRFASSQQLTRLRAELARLTELAPAEEPPGFAGTLRGYQKQGLAWLGFLHELGAGGLLADDMGLGKTVQVLAFLEGVRAAGELGSGPALVVAPRSVVDNWHREAPRFAPALTCARHLGPGRSRAAGSLRGVHLVLTSYQTLLRDLDLLAGIEWTSVFFDEAQAVKNPLTKLRRAAARLSARSRFCITGTPIENHLVELWSQVDLAMPGLLGRRSTFNQVYGSPIEKRGDGRALADLQSRIRPFLLRRSKDDVAIELPPKTEIVERVELRGGQRDLYESLRLVLDANVRDALDRRGVEGSGLVILDALLKLRQVCCDPRIVPVEDARKARESAKLDRLAELLTELAAEGRHTLVFSQFTSMLELIAARCRSLGLDTLSLTGATRDRESVIERFQAGGVPVFLISLKAGGAGINLTRADTVIHYDPWWNPATETQATDRAHRIGQDRPVFVYKLVAAGSVEDHILAMQGRKQRLSDLTLHEGGLSHLTEDDLQGLLRPLS